MFPFRPEEAFAVNNEIDIEIVTIEGTDNQVVIADDFYKNPDTVRQIILNTPYPIWKDQPDTRNFIDYYDCRQSLNLTYIAPQLAVKQIAEQFLHIAVNAPAQTFNTNLFKLLTEQPANSQPYPHDDGNLLAALVMLNTEAECSGGTAFYRCKSPRLDRMPADPERHREVHERIFSGDNYETGSHYFMENYEKYWEVLGVVPMKFNRMLVYPGVFFHGAWHEQNAFSDCYRINQVMFIGDVTYDSDYWTDSSESPRDP
jgi:hypothetical protein